MTSIATGSSSSGTYGDGSDGSLRVSGGAWQSDETGTWQNITTVSSKWTVSGLTLILHKPFKFRNVTVPAGATLQLGETSTMEWFTVLVSGDLTVDGTTSAGLTMRQSSTPGIARTTAGVGDGGSGQNIVIMCHGYRGPAGGGGGSANFIGSSAKYSVIMPVRYTFNMLRLEAFQATAGTTTVGPSEATPSNLSTAFSYDTVPVIPGGPGFTAGGGALNQTASPNASGAGGLSGRGGGICDIRAKNIIIGAAGSINANATAGANGTTGNVTGANLSIAGGGGGGGGGSGGLVRLACASMKVDGSDYTNDPYNPAVLARVTASGGLGGTGGAGRTRVDSVAALDAWAPLATYALNTWRRPRLNGPDGLDTGSDQYANLNYVVPSYNFNPGATVADLRSGLSTTGLEWATNTPPGGFVVTPTTTGASVASDDLLQPDAVTYCCRVIFDSLPAPSASRGIMAKLQDDAGPYTGFQLIVFNNAGTSGFFFTCFGSGSSGQIGGSAITTGVQYDIVVRHGPGVYDIYVNKVLYASGSYAIPIEKNTEPFVWGQDSFGQLLPGKIWDVRVYNAVVSTDVINDYTDEPDDLFTFPSSGDIAFVATAAGTTSATQPTWPTTAGVAVTDGTVTWRSVAEGANDATAFKGGDGAAGTSGVVIIEKAT